MIYENQEQLDAALAEWQKRLRLQDWQVFVRLKRQAQLSHPNSDGESSVAAENKMCNIEIVDAQDADPDNCRWTLLDHERILVHELLHIPFHHFKPKRRDGVEFVLWEQCIETLASSLVALKYESTGKSAGATTPGPLFTAKRKR